MRSWSKVLDTERVHVTTARLSNSKGPPLPAKAVALCEVPSSPQPPRHIWCARVRGCVRVGFCVRVCVMWVRGARQWRTSSRL